MTRVLAQAVHYPHPEHHADLVAAMQGNYAATAGLEGLESIGGFEDTAGGRLVAISLWSSMEHFQAGMAVLGAAIADVPFHLWERRPSEMTVMPEIPRP
ncbi:hypothetical protein Daura_19555 [Dactylosporangium aurantiacum]|uniref:ABM domain-containing protein n=1 Tax=Dactylosporangium aurantiacum TaxID=35754 RepID=A0A9Q9IRQ5_9ACTN|nr:hypothetical protein [Dactylosporangium aurantiacum]MDG6106340.1 hypothetical protein [Dactylosporangium aurantiacum]UWZ58170.1 hypothetical protein Daura_19555 [Dactylosporangium aurantiacum]